MSSVLRSLSALLATQVMANELASFYADHARRAPCSVGKASLLGTRAGGVTMRLALETWVGGGTLAIALDAADLRVASASSAAVSPEEPPERLASEPAAAPAQRSAFLIVLSQLAPADKTLTLHLTPTASAPAAAAAASSGTALAAAQSLAAQGVFNARQSCSDRLPGPRRRVCDCRRERGRRAARKGRSRRTTAGREASAVPRR
uniref:Uncharacterized protein n=2 Tax=Emiliania huxleyi TaxID=2903 RepID=A0A0D3JDJ7_EMIH1